MAERILMIDDDARLAGMVSDYLGGAGFRLTIAGTAREGEALLKRESFDAVILDLMLPDADGLDLCRRLRGTTRRADPDADRARRADGPRRRAGGRRRRLSRQAVRAARVAGPAARHPAPQGRAAAAPRCCASAGSRSTRARAACGVDGEERPLTGYQFALLLTLAERAGRVLSRDALMDLMKGEKLEAFDRSVDVHISRIRAAIEDDPKKPRRILTVRGAGYVFAKDQDR